VLASYLTTQPYTRESSVAKNISLGNRLVRWLPFDELDSTRRAARLATTCVQLIGSCILAQDLRQTLPDWNIPLAFDTFDFDNWHILAFRIFVEFFIKTKKRFLSSHDWPEITIKELSQYQRIAS